MILLLTTVLGTLLIISILLTNWKVINAWGRCTEKGAAKRAAGILDIMQAEGVEPDVLSFSLVVSAWSHSSDENAIREAEKVLDRMESWAREKNQAMEQAFDLGLVVAGDNKPSSLRTIPVRLDVECYNGVLIALSRCQESDRSDRALSLIRKMTSLADSGFETVRPNRKSLNSVLSTLSRDRSKKSVTIAEGLLDEMYERGMSPDSYSFASLLILYQNRGWSGDVDRADEVLRTMENMYFDGALSSPPDVYHYTIGEDWNETMILLFYLNSNPFKSVHLLGTVWREDSCSKMPANP